MVFRFSAGSYTHHSLEQNTHTPHSKQAFWVCISSIITSMTLSTCSISCTCTYWWWLQTTKYSENIPPFDKIEQARSYKIQSFNTHTLYLAFFQTKKITSNFSVLIFLLIFFFFFSRFGLTAYGEPCTDPCSQKGFPYAWCHKKASHNGTWIDRDYCSPGPGLTRYLEPCLTSCQVSLKKVASQLVWSGFADMIGPKR